MSHILKAKNLISLTETEVSEDKDMYEETCLSIQQSLKVF